MVMCQTQPIYAVGGMHSLNAKHEIRLCIGDGFHMDL